VSEKPDPVRPKLSYEEVRFDDSRSFAALYYIYAELFPLADEREPPEAFFEIAALNTNVGVQGAFGPWREIVASIRSWQGGPIIGGHVFGVTTSRAHIAFGCMASVQAMYTFLEPASRGRGSIREMRAYLESEALRVFGFASGAMPPLIFFEANNPLRMTEAEIEEDTRRSGISPFKRYLFWKRKGFRPLDFTYVQPRLRPDAEPVRYLDLFCSAPRETRVPAALLKHHLAAFVSISVRKGLAATEDDEFRKMASTLERGDDIGFKPEDSDEQRRILQLARER
jgi:hypothetical protein